MASSSDWIAAMQRGGEAEAQGWLAQLPVAGTFVEGAPYAARPVSQPTEPPPTPKPDPVAEAFARGKEAGREQAAQDHAATGEHQRALRLTLRSLDQAGLDTLASELAETVIALCSQAVAEFASDPDQLLERCNEAALRLGSATDTCSLHLHPDDIAMIEPDSLEGWKVIADASLARGSVRLEGPDGSVSDGPAEWRRAIAAAIRG